MIERRQIIGYSIAGVLLITLFLAISMYGTVDESEYGLKYSSWDKSLIDEEVYEAGRYYTGVFGKFIIFPKIQQTIEFTVTEQDAIVGRTQDGLALTLDVSFQYLLLKEGLVELYRTYGTAYEETFIRIARDNIRDTSSQFTAIEFFNNRTLIGIDMLDEMDANFKDYFAGIPALQLRNIDLPNSFEEALERSEVARQEVEIARLQQQEALIRAETAILEAESQRNITLIEANASAEAYIIEIEAQAEAVNITLTAEKEAYYALGQSLNMTSAELLSFMWINALVEIGEYGNLIIVGENAPIILEPVNDTATNSTSP